LNAGNKGKIHSNDLIVDRTQGIYQDGTHESENKCTYTHFWTKTHDIKNLYKCCEFIYNIYSVMFHVFTIASDASKVVRLLKTATWSGLHIEVIQLPQWCDFSDKIFAMKDVLEFIPEEDVVCFIDAYDVLCFTHANEILEKFRSYQCNLIVSSELNCFPVENKEQYQCLPPIVGTTSKYQYVNSGGYIGYCGAIKRMFQWKTDADIEEICRLGGDQQYMTQYYLEFAQDESVRIGLDIHQSIFQSMYKVSLRSFAWFEGRLYNHVLRSYPCFAHFNGFYDYQDELVHRDTGQLENAMDVFIRKMQTSLQHGNSDMDYDLPPLWYDGNLMETLPQT
jgi:hypothetical protein